MTNIIDLDAERRKRALPLPPTLQSYCAICLLTFAFVPFACASFFEGAAYARPPAA